MALSNEEITGLLSGFMVENGIDIFVCVFSFNDSDNLHLMALSDPESSPKNTQMSEEIGTRMAEVLDKWQAFCVARSRRSEDN